MQNANKLAIPLGSYQICGWFIPWPATSGRAYRWLILGIWLVWLIISREIARAILPANCGDLIDGIYVSIMQAAAYWSLSGRYENGANQVAARATAPLAAAFYCLVTGFAWGKTMGHCAGCTPDPSELAPLFCMLVQLPRRTPSFRAC